MPNLRAPVKEMEDHHHAAVLQRQLLRTENRCNRIPGQNDRILWGARSRDPVNLREQLMVRGPEENVTIAVTQEEPGGTRDGGHSRKGASKLVAGDAFRSCFRGRVVKFHPDEDDEDDGVAERDEFEDVDEDDAVEEEVEKEVEEETEEEAEEDTAR